MELACDRVKKDPVSRCFYRNRDTNSQSCLARCLAVRVNFPSAATKIKKRCCCAENGDSPDWTYGKDNVAFASEGDAWRPQGFFPKASSIIPSRKAFGGRDERGFSSFIPCSRKNYINSRSSLKSIMRCKFRSRALRSALVCRYLSTIRNPSSLNISGQASG